MEEPAEEPLNIDLASAGATSPPYQSSSHGRAGSAWLLVVTGFSMPIVCVVEPTTRVADASSSCTIFTVNSQKSVSQIERLVGGADETPFALSNRLTKL